MPTPSRNAIYDATIRRMTACALEEAENRFAVEHAQDTEQQLADYLRKYADELGHTPWPREIPGGVTIQTRGCLSPSIRTSRASSGASGKRPGASEPSTARRKPKNGSGRRNE